MTYRHPRELPHPCFVADLDHFRSRFRRIREAFEAHFREVAVGYSYKTNYLPALLEEVERLDGWAEVVSHLEYRLARRVGVPPERIIFNGPNKTYEHLADALSAGAVVNLDSLEEVDRVCRWVRQEGQPRSVGLRVNVSNPDFSDHRAQSRFGLPPSALVEAERRLREVDVEVAGLHAHLSTNTRDLEVFRQLVDTLGRALEHLDRCELDYVDVGGGMGYAPSEMGGLSFPSFSAYAEDIRERFDAWFDDPEGMRLMIEPGISTVGDTMSFYTPVRAIKEIEDRNVAFVDGSIQDVKPTGHDHNLPTEVFTSAFEAKPGEPRLYDVVGYTCMADDYVAIEQSLPKLEVGDILRIDNVGAYTIVFTPPFIRSAPPIFVLDDGRYRTARRRESFDDFFASYRFDLQD
jgi:diaminopimelate decarboxylase